MGDSQLRLGIEETEGYAIDTSSLIEIEVGYATKERAAIWDCLTQLIVGGKLKSVEFVLEELKRNQESVHQRLQPLRDILVVPLVDVWEPAGVIARRFPTMSGVGRRPEKADAWVVGLASALHLTVVCNESKQRLKMPYVCAQIGIQCVKVHQLISAECDT